MAELDRKDLVAGIDFFLFLHAYLSKSELGAQTKTKNKEHSKAIKEASSPTVYTFALSGMGICPSSIPPFRLYRRFLMHSSPIIPVEVEEVE